MRGIPAADKGEMFCNAKCSLRNCARNSFEHLNSRGRFRLHSDELRRVNSAIKQNRDFSLLLKVAKLIAKRCLDTVPFDVGRQVFFESLAGFRARFIAKAWFGQKNAAQKKQSGMTEDCCCSTR